MPVILACALKPVLTLASHLPAFRRWCYAYKRALAKLTAGAKRHSLTGAYDALPRRAPPRTIQTKGQLQPVLGCTRKRDRDSTS